MEFLKAVLGDELYNQVAEKLNGNDNIKLANLADGGYVGKDKFDKLKLENDELKKVDAATLQAENDQLKKDNDALKLGSKIDLALMSEQAVNVTAVKALLEMDKISLDGDKLVGFDEQITPLKESQKWAFVQPNVPGAGGNPAPPADGANEGTFADAIAEAIR